MSTTAQERAEITHTVDLYIEGVRDGDAAKLRDAFHPDARMWGSMSGERYDEPIAELIAMVDGNPVDVDGSYQARVTSVEQTDDIASVVLLEDGFWGSVSFVDYLDLARIDGTWRIINKTFAHTGGEPPAPA